MLLKNLRPFSYLHLADFTVAQNVFRSSHIWMITEEIQSNNDVVGNSHTPSYNQLIHQSGLATQFYADQHSSFPPLMRFVAGAPVELNNNTTSSAHYDDNAVRELLKRGLLTREGTPSPSNPRMMRWRDHVSARKLELETG
jgi:hypothetical protein